MLFNSYIFIFIFLPVCLLGYYRAIGKQSEWQAKAWLAGMSLWFYGSFGIAFFSILVVSVGFNYTIYKGMTVGKYRKGLLLGGIACNIFLLAYFKYAGFFIESINGLTDGSLAAAKILLPLGLSFYTFSQISFLVDAYKGEIRECGLLEYTLFITYFPKLAEGPIVTYGELMPQFQDMQYKRLETEKLMRGISLFVFGMAKKVLLADTFGGAVNYGYSNLSDMHSSDAVLLVIFYSLQLYFDFSGYIDMARGISRMFGIELPVNFKSPYKAANIVDFWKRWHITLNRFFTKYIYIPLGGNRNGDGKMYRNLLIIFFISGIWHGAGWNFILWGIAHGLLYIFTRMWQKRRIHVNTAAQAKNSIMKSAGKGICIFLTFFFVSTAWVFFRADSIAQGVEVFNIIGNNEFVRVNRNLAGYFNLDEFWYVIKIIGLDAWEFAHYILMAAFTAVSLGIVFLGKNASETADKMKPKISGAVVTAGLFLWCVLTFSRVSTFLYFNF